MEPGRELLAAGAFDGHVRVYSTTDNAIKIGAVMPCHTAPVSQVAWSPTNNNHLVTAGLCDQQNLRIWDIRRLALSLSPVSASLDCFWFELLWPSFVL